MIEGAARNTAQRLFFALWPHDPIRAALCERAKAVIPAGGRAVPCPNLHLTLAFLGPVSADQRAGMEAVADAVAVKPFMLTVDQTGLWRRKGIAWIGCGPLPKGLAAIVGHFRGGMQTAGIRTDDCPSPIGSRRGARCRDAPVAPFAAHITVARDVNSPLRSETIQPLEWPVREFALMRSVSSRGGVQYDLLRSWPLA